MNCLNYCLASIVIVALAIINVYSIPLASDDQITVEEYRDECNIGKQMLDIGKIKFKDDEQLQHYITMLESGINDLVKKTETIIEHEQDEKIKMAAIQFGYESCNRLVAFITDIYEKINPH